MSAGIGFDRIDGEGSYTLGGVLLEAPKWAKKVASDGKGILVEVWEDDRYTVTVTAAVVAGNCRLEHHKGAKPRST